MPLRGLRDAVRRLGAGLLLVWLREANLKVVALHTASCNYKLVLESRVDRKWWLFVVPVPPEEWSPGCKGVIATFTPPG